jgi:hypothetical protein
MRTSRLAAAAGAGGLVLLVTAALLLWLGLAGDHPGATVAGILLGVLGLVGLRIWSWVRKEQVLRRVGQDLHRPDE